MRTYLCFGEHAWRQVGGDLLKRHVAVGVLQQGLRRVAAVDQDHLEPMAVTQVAQLARKVHVGC